MEFKNYIDGQWISGPDVLPNISPSDTSDVVGLFASADAGQVQAAIESARKAFPGWAATTPQKRADILDAVGSAILSKVKYLGALLAREEGKVLSEAMGEVTRAGHIFKWCAGESLRLTGEVVASIRPGVGVEITREPLGVIGLITPWNFPIAIPAWKMAPALAFGNTVVIKPSEAAPACTHAIVALLEEAGLPPGVVNLVMGTGPVVGGAMVESPLVDAISFTGSVGTGRAIGIRCTELGKKFQLEMGGKNPTVVLDDADLSIAVEACVNSAFFSTGQRCTASSRLIVTNGIHDAFVDAVKARLKTIRVGHALDPATHIGPVVDERQLNKDMEYIQIGVKEGAQLFGGERLTRSTHGFFLEPALFSETSPDMRINREEIFGPVASVIRAKDYEEALALANATEFGLSAGICTQSLKYATHFKRAAQAGMVMVNLPTAGVDYHVPFGGRKASSLGSREQGSYSREFYTTVKTSYTLA